MKKILYVLVFAASFSIAPHTAAAPIAQELKQPDPRSAKLKQFFDRYHGAKPYPITSYLNAADKYGVDYRLLPAISVAESSAGKHACGNNWYGWQSCKGRLFASVADCIQFISNQLAHGIYYRGKTIDKQLRAYNPNPAYAPKVEKLMKEISE